MSAPPVSRIPRLIPNRTPSAPTKLDLLREQFHQQRIREKEAILMKIFQERQTAMFSCRMYNQNGRQLINSYTQKKKLDGVIDNNRRALVNQNRDMTGRDKATPLTPIEQRTRQPLKQVPHLPHLPQEEKPVRQQNVFVRHHSHPIMKTQQQNTNNNESENKNINQLLRSASGDLEKDDSTKKMTSFQKWQLQQKEERDARLKKCRQTRSNSAEKEQVKRATEDRKPSDLEKPPMSKRSSSQAQRASSLQKARKRTLSRQKSAHSGAEDEDLNSSFRTTDSRVSSQRDPLEDIRQKEQRLMELIKQEQAALDSMKKKRHLKEEMDGRTETVSRGSRRSRLREASQRAENREASSRSVSPAINTNTYSLKPPRKKAVPPPKRPSYKPPETEYNNERIAFYVEKAKELADDAQYAPADMLQCNICERNFATDRLDKHMTVCAKITKKKRKVFDQVKMRTEGTEQAKYVKYIEKKENKVPQTNWRKKHEGFVQSLRHARHASKMIAEGRTPPPALPTENPDYIQCEHCSRRFSPAAAERHIPLCRNLKSRPHPPGMAKTRAPPRGVGTQRHR